MSCRETGAGSAFTSWARLYTGSHISEPATLSTFHQLRNVYLSRTEADRRIYTEAEYRSLLQRQRERVQTSTLSEARRRSILARLDRADIEPMPDQATCYALFNVTPAVRNRSTSLNDWLENLSDRTGENVETLRTRFNTLSANVTRRSVTGIPREQEERVASMGLTRDRGTVHAVMQMESEARHIEAERARRAPLRIQEDSWNLPNANEAETSIAGITVERWGYDPRNGRLEVALHDAATGETEYHAYRGVDSSVIDSFHAHAGSAWFNRVRGNQMYQYADADEAALDGAAPRCDNCGQFADAAHSCPPTVSRERWRRWGGTGRWTNQSVPIARVDDDGNVHMDTFTVTLPAIRRLQQSAAAGIAEISVDQHIRYMTTANGRTSWSHGSISGVVEAQRMPDRTYDVRDGGLTCSCPTFRESGTCEHVDAALRAVRYRLERPNDATIAQERATLEATATVAAAERVQQAAERAIASDWTRNPETAAEAAATWRREAEVLYSENPDEFLAVVDAARAAKDATGQPVIPYMREDVLDGMCRRGEGKAFGVEIEYQFDETMPYDERRAAQVRIGRELFEAGLTYSPDQQGYRSSSRRGFRDTHTDENGVGNWSWEHDGSVDGELVTPGMYDEPETWEKLETALTILRRNGAVGGLKAGAHVHVGTGDYASDGTSVAEYTELGRMVTQHEDVLVRLSSNPFRGTHRNNGYSRPLPAVPPSGFATVQEARNWQDRSAGRYATLNLGNCVGAQEDHPEFRVFDASLDPGTVQSQIKLAVALTEAASRNARAGGTSRGKEEWGAHVRRSRLSSNVEGYEAPTDPRQQILEESTTTRSLLDTLFRRRVDKEQLAAVWANTQWSDMPTH